MIEFDDLTDKQVQIIKSYAFGGIGWFRAVSKLTTLGISQKDAEKLVNETGQMWDFG